MPYVERNASNAIIGVYANSQPGRATEFLADNASEVMAFLDPTPVPSWSGLDFLDRFTQVELEGIATAARTNATVAVWMQRAGSAQVIHSGDAKTVAGMQAMVDAGLLTAARRDQILSAAASP